MARYHAASCRKRSGAGVKCNVLRVLLGQYRPVALRRRTREQSQNHYRGSVGHPRRQAECRREGARPLDVPAAMLPRRPLRHTFCLFNPGDVQRHAMVSLLRTASAQRHKGGETVAVQAGQTHAHRLRYSWSVTEGVAVAQAHAVMENVYSSARPTARHASHNRWRGNFSAALLNGNANIQRPARRWNEILTRVSHVASVRARRTTRVGDASRAGDISVLPGSVDARKRMP